MRSVCLIFAALPVSAEVFQPPEGCSPLMSVQHRECSVSLYWDCKGQAGYWTAAVGEDGPLWITGRTETGQWTEMTYAATSFSLRAVEVLQPSDHRNLLAGRIDRYNYTMATPDGAFSETYVGQTDPDGRVVVDGEDLLRISYDYTVKSPEGSVVRSVTGFGYLLGDRPLSIAGSWQSSLGQSGAGEPVSILTEGEPGFMDMTPQYDCGDLTS